MSKIDDEELLSTGLSYAFDGSEIRLLANLLDDQMADWTEDRKKRYAPIYDDLTLLADRLLSNGHDYGLRKARRWADDPPETPDDLFVHVICGCATRIKIVIRTGAEDLDTWDVTCPRHQPGTRARHLGVICVKGVPDRLIHAQTIAQQILVLHEEDLKNFDTHTFKANAKF